MGDQNIDIVQIPIAEYNEMIKRLDWLDCLEAAGVDNWQGIEEAIEMFKGDSNND